MRNIVNVINIIKNTRRYDLLRGPTSSSCVGLQPSAEAFFPLGKKKFIMMFWLILGHFCYAGLLLAPVEG